MTKGGQAARPVPPHDPPTIPGKQLLPYPGPSPTIPSQPGLLQPAQEETTNDHSGGWRTLVETGPQQCLPPWDSQDPHYLSPVRGPSRRLYNLKLNFKTQASLHVSGHY